MFIIPPSAVPVSRVREIYFASLSAFINRRRIAERLGMNSRTIIDLETGKSNPKFETVVLVAKELNISVDAAIFPEMVNQTVSKTVVDFFAGKSEAEIEKFIALCKQAEAFQKGE